MLLGDFCKLQVRLLFFLQRFGKQSDSFLLAQSAGNGNIGSISCDFVMLDALHPCDDDQIEHCSLSTLLDFVLGFLNKTSHGLTNLAPRTNFEAF